MITRFVALLLFLAAACSAPGAWEIVSAEPASASDAVCRHLELRAVDNESGARATLHLALFDSSRATIAVVDQPAEPRRDLAEVMSAGEFLAGVNGGYFDPQDAPVGLLVREGKVVAPLRKARLLSGVVSVARGRLRLQRTAEYSSKRVKEALQCGPFLVERNRPVAGLKKERDARRTFVAIDKTNTAAIGFCSSVSLADLAEILSAISASQALKVERALNLDGGSSSAFWFRDDDGEPFSISERKTVRDFIAIKLK